MSNQLNLGRVKGYSEYELWLQQEGNAGGSYEMFEASRKGETGATGADGAEGVQGIQGVQGEQGEQGVQGEQGIQGIQGLNGEDGTALKVSYTVQSKDDLDTHTEDEYKETIALVINEGAYYSYSPNIDSGEYAWTYLPNVGTGTQGPEGPQGIQGVQGEQGPQGIQGEQGVQGVQGLNGIQGIQGEQGETISDMSLSTSTFEATTLDNVNVIRAETNTGRALYYDVITKSVEGPQGVQGEQGIQGPAGENGIMTQEIYDALIARIEALESK